MNKECKLCQSWDPLHSNKVLGRCRKHPPVANKQPNKVTTGEWPTTYEADWCDDFIWKKGVENG